MYSADVITRIQDALLNGARLVLNVRFPDGLERSELVIAEVDRDQVLAYNGDISYRFELEGWMLKEMLQQL